VPKIGKSTFCANSDNALFLATEAGLNNLSVYQVPIATWGEFLDACQQIAAGQHGFKTIIIDTIDNLYKMCVTHILQKHNLQHESDAPFGKGYALINGAFEKVLTALSLLPYGLIMTSHAQEKEVKTPTGAETRISPTLPNGARKIVLGMADLILFAEMQEVRNEQGRITGYERVVRTKPTTIYEAGDRTSKLPETLPLDYACFAQAMGQGVSAPVATVNPEPCGFDGAEVTPEVAPTSEPITTTTVKAPKNGGSGGNKPALTMST